MDEILKKRIADSVLEYRHEAIVDYVFGFLIGEKSDSEMCAGILRLKAEEKARILSQDEMALGEGERKNQMEESEIELTPC